MKFRFKETLFDMTDYRLSLFHSSLQEVSSVVESGDIAGLLKLTEREGIKRAKKQGFPRWVSTIQTAEEFRDLLAKGDEINPYTNFTDMQSLAEDTFWNWVIEAGLRKEVVHLNFGELKMFVPNPPRPYVHMIQLSVQKHHLYEFSMKGDPLG